MTPMTSIVITNSNMYAYELLPKLTYLTLTVEDGKIEFWGTNKQWNLVNTTIRTFEMIHDIGFKAKGFKATLD